MRTPCLKESQNLEEGVDYEKNVMFTIDDTEHPGCGSTFEVDYYFNSGKIFEYVSHSESLSGKLDNKSKLECAGEFPVFRVYSPESEIISALDN